MTVRDDAPSLRDVRQTNRVHVNARVVRGRVVVVSAIDNLVKGASGQAVQNANLMMGLRKERAWALDCPISGRLSEIRRGFGSESW